MIEALKYEKRIETQFTAWTGWWVDGRGWVIIPNVAAQRAEFKALFGD